MGQDGEHRQHRYAAKQRQSLRLTHLRPAFPFSAAPLPFPVYLVQVAPFSLEGHPSGIPHYTQVLYYRLPITPISSTSVSL